MRKSTQSIHIEGSSQLQDLLLLDATRVSFCLETAVSVLIECVHLP